MGDNNVRNTNTTGISHEYRVVQKQLSDMKDLLVKELTSSDPNQKRIAEIKQEYVKLISIAFNYESKNSNDNVA